MSMSVSQGGGDEEEQAIADINVTPLVDVMLVLLIIFLITLPVVKQAQPVTLPKVSNIETRPKPENIELSIVEGGDVWLGARKFSGQRELKEYIISRATEVPQPEVHIRADSMVRYESVGRAIMAVQLGGIVRVAFITEPPPR
jgi:biopolymer transport protein ExbD